MDGFSANTGVKGMDHSRSVLFLVVVSVLIYANSLGNGFVWDDHLFITHNPWFQDSRFVPFYFTKEFCEGSGTFCGFYRPLVSLSYFVDFFLWGLDPFGFHLTNILIHSLAVVGVYWFAFELCGSETKKLKPLKRGFNPSALMPFGSALFFAIHPIHVESIASIANRTDPPTAVFMVASLLGYIFWRRKDSPNRKIGYFISILFFLFALLTKEMAVTFPVLLLVYDFLMVKKKESPFLKMVIPHIPFWTMVGLYFGVRWLVLGKSFGLSLEGGDLFHRLIHVPALLMGYLKIMLFPLDLRLYHPLPSVENHPILDGILPLFALIFLVYWVFKNRASHPLLAFSLIWLVVTLLPVLNIVPIKHPAETERFSYIPSIGFCLMIGWGIVYIFNWAERKSLKYVKGGVVSILILILLVFAGMVVNRNQDWATNLTLWSEEIKKSPYSSLTHFNYGVILDENGKGDEAAFHYGEAIRLNPSHHFSYLNLGKLHETKGEIEKAVDFYRRGVALAPQSFKAHYSLGTVLLKKGELDLAREAFEKAIDLNPNYSPAYNNLGSIWFSKNEIEKAYGAFQEAVRLDPNNAEAHQNLGVVLKKKGDYKEAEKEWLKAIHISPKLISAHRSLGFLYFEQLHQKEKALTHLLEVRGLLSDPDEEVEQAIEMIQNLSRKP